MSKIDEVMKAWQEDHQKVSWQDLQTLKAENEALRAQLGQTAVVQQEPVGVVGAMPGTSGFTMACFHADKVPVGSKLYTHPAPQQKPLTDEQIVDAYCKGLGMRQYVEAYFAGARFAEAAHNIGEKK